MKHTKENTMFKVETEREEKAYRLGYVEAWSVAQLSALTLAKRVAGSPRATPPGEIYRAMRVYQVDILWPWLREESPEIDEPAPEFVIL